MTRVKLHQKHKHSTAYSLLDVDNNQIPLDTRIRVHPRVYWHVDSLECFFDILKEEEERIFFLFSFIKIRISPFSFYLHQKIIYFLFIIMRKIVLIYCIAKIRLHNLTKKKEEKNN